MVEKLKPSKMDLIKFEYEMNQLKKECNGSFDYMFDKQTMNLILINTGISISIYSIIEKLLDSNGYMPFNITIMKNNRRTDPFEFINKINDRKIKLKVNGISNLHIDYNPNFSNLEIIGKPIVHDVEIDFLNYIDISFTKFVEFFDFLEFFDFSELDSIRIKNLSFIENDKNMIILLKNKISNMKHIKKIYLSFIKSYSINLSIFNNIDDKEIYIEPSGNCLFEIDTTLNDNIKLPSNKLNIVCNEVVLNNLFKTRDITINDYYFKPTDDKIKNINLFLNIVKKYKNNLIKRFICDNKTISDGMKSYSNNNITIEELEEIIEQDY